MTPYTSLGFYNPPRWRAWMVGRDITRITEEAGLVSYSDPLHRHQVKAAWCNVDKAAYVRRRTVHNPKAAQWHQDGDLTGERMDISMVLWSSNTPTEIRLPSGEIFQPRPYEVGVINNLACEHRRPPGAPKVRWLFRQIVENV